MKAAGRRREGSSGSRWTLVQVAPFAVLSVLVIGVPLVLLVTYSFRDSGFAGIGPGPTFTQYREVLDSAATTRTIGKTVAVGLGISTLITALSFVFSYGIAFRLPRRTAFIALGLVAATWIASFLVRVYAWGAILGNRGLLNSALLGLGVIDEPLRFLLLGYFAIVVTMMYVYLPIGLLVLSSAMQGVNQQSLEASRDLGVGRFRTAVLVIAPQVRTAIVTVFVLTVILTTADFITPQLVGGTQGQMIGSIVRDRALLSADFPGAAALSFSFLALLAVAMAVLAGAWFASRPLRATAVKLAASVMARHPGLRKRRIRWSLSRPVVYAVMAFLLAPTLLVVIFSFNSGVSVGLPFEGFTLGWYPRLMARTGFVESLQNGVLLSAIAVIGAVLLGLPTAFALRDATGRLKVAIWVLVALPYIVPGVLLGTALLTVASQQSIPLGLPLTALVHTLLVTPIIVMIVYTRLVGLDKHLVEAARDLGSTEIRALQRIVLPLIIPSLLAAMLIGVAISLDEILNTTFVIGAQSTVATWLLGQARAGYNPSINALGVLLLVGAGAVFLSAVGLVRRSGSSGDELLR